MAESPENRRRDSESSGEVSVRIEREIGGGSRSDSKDVNNVGSLNNGGTGPPGL